MKKLSLALAVLSLGACAHYRPEPLPSAADALSAPAKAVSGEVIDLSAPLGPDAVAAIAVRANPDLKALRAQIGIADAQVYAAGLMPDPRFSMGVDHILSGPDPLDNLAAALGLDLNALRTRSVLKQQAAAERQRVRMDVAWVEWQTACQARLTAIRVAYLTRIGALAEQSARETKGRLVMAVTAFKAGDIPASQLTAAQSAADDAKLLSLQANLDLADAALALDHLLGLPPGTGIQLSVPTDRASPQQSPNQLYEIAVAHRADLQALRAAYDAQEASVHKAVLDQFPTLDLTINASRDTGGNKLLGPSVGFTLPLWNRNRGGIAIERATRSALKSDYEARLAMTRSALSSAVAVLKTTAYKRKFLETDVRVLGRHADHSRKAAARGDLSSVAASDTALMHRDREISLVALEQAAAEQMIALELLTGLPKEQWK